MDNKQFVEDVNKAIEKKPTKAVTALSTFKGYSGKEISTFFANYKERLGQLTRQSPDKIVETATQMILTNPNLVGCTITSIAGALMQSAILDLEVVPQLGNCYFVPYGKKIVDRNGEHWVQEVQFQIGYRGWLTLVRRSKQIRWIDAFEVSTEEFQQGFYKVTLGLKPDIKHERMINIDVKADGSNLAHVYAVCELMNGSVQFKSLSKEQIENYRKRSPSQRKKVGNEYVYNPTGAWATDYPAMAKAKVLKQLCKFLPLEEFIQEALATDEAVINEEAIKGDKVNLASVSYPDAEASNSEPEPVDAVFEDGMVDEASPKEVEVPLSWKFVKGTKKFSACLNALKEKEISGHLVDEEKWTITFTEELVKDPKVIEIYKERMGTK